MTTRRHSPGFTLIEICIVIFLAITLISIAMPSLSGQLGRRRLQEASDRFDALAIRARERSITEGQPYLLVWEKGGAIALYPANASQAQRNRQGPVSELRPSSANERYTLVRSASLSPNPAPVWTFWPTGNCEPVTVRYQSGGGEWEAVYNPLSCRSVFTRFLAR